MLSSRDEKIALCASSVASSSVGEREEDSRASAVLRLRRSKLKISAGGSEADRFLGQDLSEASKNCSSSIISISISMARSSQITFYLVLYNLVQAFGWATVLVRIMLNVVQTRSIDGAFDAAGVLVRYLQLAAFLEVVHSALGLVPSGVSTALLQWGGRYHWIAAVVWNIKEVQRLPSVFITFAAWSLSEVIRYPQYALSMLDLCPPWWTWLRYSAFIPLYPMGALCGEVLLVYQALPFIKKKNLYPGIFRKLPFDYYSFIVVLLVLYPFLWLSLYIHMFKQRQSKLQKRSPGKRKSQIRSD